jgi:hypothetical protein
MVLGSKGDIGVFAASGVRDENHPYEGGDVLGTFACQASLGVGLHINWRILHHFIISSFLFPAAHCFSSSFFQSCHSTSAEAQQVLVNLSLDDSGWGRKRDRNGWGDVRLGIMIHGFAILYHSFSWDYHRCYARCTICR